MAAEKGLGIKNMINVKNTYGKLKEILLGDFDPGILKLVAEENRPKIEWVYEQSTEDLTSIQKILEDWGVQVHRPKMFDSAREFNLPRCTIYGQKIPLTPRDHFLILGDTVIETASYNRDAFFVGSYWRDTLNHCFDQGAKWISMPYPMHDIDDVDEFEDGIPNVDPMIDAPNVLIHNDVLFLGTRGSANPRGVQWIERHYGDQYKIIKMNPDKFIGHLDTHMNILKPGLLFTFHDREDFPDYFNDWEIIKPNTQLDHLLRMQQRVLDGRIQDDDFMNTVLIINSLSLDEKTLLVHDIYKDKEYELIKELESRGFEFIFFPFKYAHFVNNGISCMTLEINRES